MTSTAHLAPAIVRPRSVVPFTRAALAAIDVLRGVGPGTFITDELLTDEGESAFQTVVAVPEGIVLMVSEVEVSERRRTFVRQMSNRVRRRLNLPTVSVRFFGPARLEDGAEVFVHDVSAAHPIFAERAAPGTQRVVGGMTTPVFPWTIWLNASLAGDELVRTIAHELRHCDQLWGASVDVPEDERERDAIAFADGWMARR